MSVYSYSNVIFVSNNGYKNVLISVVNLYNVFLKKLFTL